MTITEALEQIRAPGALADEQELRRILSELWISAEDYRTNQIRKEVAERGPQVLHELDIEYQPGPGKRHGIIVAEGTVNTFLCQYPHYKRYS